MLPKFVASKGKVKINSKNNRLIGDGMLFTGVSTYRIPLDEAELGGLAAPMVDCNGSLAKTVTSGSFNELMTDWGILCPKIDKNKRYSHRGEAAHPVNVNFWRYRGRMVAHSFRHTQRLRAKCISSSFRPYFLTTFTLKSLA